jgi:ATP-dependent RNA helicase DDX3X
VLGRTGRIGHRGVATSFYSERDEPIASVLARTLLETGQDIPEFLQFHLPDGATRETVKFEVESDFDENDVAGAGEPTDGAWGGGDDNANANANPSGVWGQADDSVQQAAAAAAWGGGDNAGASMASGWDAGNQQPVAASAW